MRADAAAPGCPALGIIVGPPQAAAAAAGPAHAGPAHRLVAEQGAAADDQRALVIDRPAHPRRPAAAAAAGPAHRPPVAKRQVLERQGAGRRHLEQPEINRPDTSERLPGPLDGDGAGDEKGGRPGRLGYGRGAGRQVGGGRKGDCPAADGRAEHDGVRIRGAVRLVDRVAEAAGPGVGGGGYRERGQDGPVLQGFDGRPNAAAVGRALGRADGKTQRAEHGRLLGSGRAGGVSPDPPQSWRSPDFVCGLVCGTMVRHRSRRDRPAPGR